MTLARLLAGTAAVLLSIAAAPAGPPNDIRHTDRITPERVAPPYYRDADADGTLNVFDCNDDDPAIRPGATEILNGFDDDCDGTIDDGFDTSIDRPTATVALALWPQGTPSRADEWVSLEAAPRIVATSDGFLTVWSDLGNRLRVARVLSDGTMPDGAPLVLAAAVAAPDAAWTGSRLAVVYEDRSSGGSDVRMTILDPAGRTLLDTLVQADAYEPRIVWGHEMFGVVWRRASCAGDCIAFQRFDRDGRIAGPFEILRNSGRGAAIAWSGMGVTTNAIERNSHPGRFGIVYEAHYGLAASADVVLALRDTATYGGGPEVIANAHDNVISNPGARPAVAGNPSGFGVSWHVVEGDKDRGHLRFFSASDLTPASEYLPDLDQATASSLAWTGSEFVAVNENAVVGPPGGTDVHLRRLDPTCNAHAAAGWGPWSEVNLSCDCGGRISTNPAVANAGTLLGVVWVEQEGANGYGRVRLALLAHR